MTDIQLTAWGKRYGITLPQVKRLQTLIGQYATQRVAYCNGDVHPNVIIRSDKNANSQAWEKDSDVTGRVLSRFAKQIGFTGVDFGVGVYPALEKDGDSCIHVPEMMNNDED